MLKNRESFFLGSHDVRFDNSLIHAHILTELYKRWVSTCIIRILYDMYTRLIVVVNLLDIMITEIVMPDSRGVKQGAPLHPQSRLITVFRTYNPKRLPLVF